MAVRLIAAMLGAVAALILATLGALLYGLWRLGQSDPPDPTPNTIGPATLYVERFTARPDPWPAMTRDPRFTAGMVRAAAQARPWRPFWR